MKKYEVRAAAHNDNDWQTTVRGPLEYDDATKAYVGPVQFLGNRSATKDEALAFGRNHLIDTMNIPERQIHLEY